MIQLMQPEIEETSTGISLYFDHERVRQQHARPGSPLRSGAEVFVRTCYERCFGATLGELMPDLVVARGDDGTIHATAGLRPADEGGLFLEQYLDEPIEAALERFCDRRVARSEIVEVGNLAVSRPGIARVFFQALALDVASRGQVWVAFTGTSHVLAVFARLGMDLLDLGPADPARLVADTTQWGSYYAHKPRVAAVFVPSGFERVDASRFEPEQLASLIRAAGERTQ